MGYIAGIFVIGPIIGGVILLLYSGTSVEAVLDRLPTAKVVSQEDGVYRITAEVYGNGIDMWLRSQESAVKVVEK